MKKLIILLITSNIISPIAICRGHRLGPSTSDLTFVDIHEVKIFKTLKKLERAKENKNQRLVDYYTKKAIKYLKVFESKELSPGIIEKLF